MALEILVPRPAERVSLEEREQQIVFAHVLERMTCGIHEYKGKYYSWEENHHGSDTRTEVKDVGAVMKAAIALKQLLRSEEIERLSAQDRARKESRGR